METRRNQKLEKTETLKGKSGWQTRKATLQVGGFYSVNCLRMWFIPDQRPASISINRANKHPTTHRRRLPSIDHEFLGNVPYQNLIRLYYNNYMNNQSFITGCSPATCCRCECRSTVSGHSGRTLPD